MVLFFEQLNVNGEAVLLPIQKRQEIELTSSSSSSLYTISNAFKADVSLSLKCVLPITRKEA